MFPTYLDILPKEKPVLQGIKLLIIFDIFWLKELLRSTNLPSTAGSLVFSISEIILVRSEESKEKFKKLFPNVDCAIFTIEKAKGLEFESVILYNFFAESTVSEETWRLLELIDPTRINIYKNHQGENKK